MDSSTQRTLLGHLKVLSVYLHALQSTQEDLNTIQANLQYFLEKVNQDFNQCNKKLANCTKDMLDAINDFKREVNR